MSSSSSSLSPRICYDVFLSFRGEDTRRTFVGHLNRSLVRKGIRVFSDENETEKTPELSTIHQDVIAGSKVAVIVISKNYASSPRCLEELAQIIQCERKCSLIVFPVFYEIEPSDVLGKPGEFAKRLRKQNPEMVERWRKSLTQLLCIPAEHSSKWEDDSELIQKIADDISNKLSSSRFDGLVGMDSRVSSVYQLLCLDSVEDELGVIGIWGRAGLGKRTLAKFVYGKISHRFDVCVRIEGADMIHHGHDSLVLGKLLQSKFTDGLAMNSRGGTARVLLVAEDVKTVEQIDILRKVVKRFGTWSRIIVTCENRSLLLASGITFLYQVEPLTFDDAFELMSLLVFNQTHPPEGFEMLLTRAVLICKGFPREIAAVGSELAGRAKKDWKAVYEQLSFEVLFGMESTFSETDAGDRSCMVKNTIFNGVGMDRHIQAVCGGLMELESDNGTRIVGICGVGGAGKTILARCVYNETMQNFHTHIFLENVGKIYQDHGSSWLQEELLWETIQRSFNNGSDVTKARLQYRKILLIVDDVDHNKQLEDVKKVATWFGAGSRVIVITRDKNLLEDNGVKHVYEVKSLKVHEALELFYRIAFKQQTPSSHFKQLSIRAVQLSGRIPLALEVLASFLHGKSENEWESVLQKLETEESSIIDVEVSSDEEAEDSFGDYISDESWDEPSTMDP